MKKLILSIALCVTLIATGCGNSGNSSGNSRGDLKAEKAIISSGTKSVFTPKSDAAAVNSMVAAMESRGVQCNASQNINAAEEAAVENALVPNVLYSILADGTSKEIVFDSTEGQKIRVEAFDLTDAGDGYLYAWLGRMSLVTEITDNNGNTSIG